jgi:hypothetical protein
MVLRQHTLKKLNCLLAHQKSILVPPKCRVHDSDIAHCLAYSKERQSTSQPNRKKLRHTYVRMVLRQHTLQKLKRLLAYHKSILVPPKSRVRGSETDQ